MPPKRRRDDTTQMTLSRAGTLRAPAQQTLGFKRAAVVPSDAVDMGDPVTSKGARANGQQLERTLSNAVPEDVQVKEETAAVKLEQVPAWPAGAWVKEEPTAVPSGPAETEGSGESQQSRSTEEE